ncbi:hypothetical protein BT69DRAFT_1051481 [Atractiella rhizophila]|nr:hypothetical protein BT69DRAFT_1051481 [Atractiella rhizophila]
MHAEIGRAHRSESGSSSSSPSAKRAIPPNNTTLSERIARLNLDKSKEAASQSTAKPAPQPLTHAVPSSSAPIKERLKKFANDGSEAPLVPKGSFGMGAPASKIIPDPSVPDHHITTSLQWDNGA